MNRKTLAVLFACATFGTSAMAAGGDITFEGELIKNHCIPDVEGQGPSAVVKLNPVYDYDLPTIGSTAGERPFKMHLTGCSKGDHIVRAYFYNTSAAEVSNSRLNKHPGDTGTGKGWQYQLLNEAGTYQIDVGTTHLTSAMVTSGQLMNLGVDPGVDVQAGGGQGGLVYRVRYYRNGDLVAGKLLARTVYTLFSN